MKKIVYLFAILGLILTGCNPMDDIYNDIDAQNNPIVGETEFTMTADDYAEIDPTTDDDSYETYENFPSVDDAKVKIADYLSVKFPYWGATSLATVTFNVYKPNNTNDLVSYEVTTEDYDNTGFTYGNFDSEDDFATFFAYKYPDAVRGDYVELTYRYYVGGGVTEDRVNKFVYLDEWQMVQELTSEDYTAMGQTYPNFSNEDTATYRIGIYLESLFPYAEAGAYILTMYELYVSGAPNEFILAPYTFDGDKWQLITNVVPETVKFGHDGTQWVPDNTIAYTLLGGDYAYIVDQLSSDPAYESATASMDSYGNFDRREGNAAYWSDDMVLNALGLLLDHIDPSAAEGQKYNMTFNVYIGSNTTETFKLIKEAGVWIKQPE